MCLLLLVFTACERNDEAIPSSAPASAPELQSGTLASVQRPDGAQTNFIQLSEGFLVVQTLYSLDSDVPYEKQVAYMNEVRQMVSSGKAYSDIYRELAGSNTVQESIALLNKADVLYKAALKNVKPIPSNVNIDDILAGMDTESRDFAAGRTAACSSDLFHDSWGAQWFIDNFGMVPKPVVTPGGTIFPPLPSNFRSLIGTNITSSGGWSEQMFGKTFYNVNVMAADFNVGAQVKILLIDTSGCPGAPCGTLRLSRTFSISPRFIQSFVMGPQAGGGILIAEGLSPCPRIHYARLKDV